MYSQLTTSVFTFLNIRKVILIQLFLLFGSINSYAVLDIEVTANITEVGADYLVVQGITFSVDQNTEVIGRHNDPISFSLLQGGDLVEVKYNEGSTIALRIRLEDNPGNENELEITGYVTEVGANYFIINGDTFYVDENTEFKGRHGNSFSFAQVEVGLLLEVKAVLEPDQTLLAVRVKTEDDHEQEHGQEVEITGKIDSITVNSIIINKWEFFVNAQTTFLGDHNTPISFSDLHINDKVEVKAFRQPDNTLLAVRIKFEDNHENEIEITASIDNIEENNITVQGITFNTDSNTVFLGHNRQPITIASLVKGMLVEIKGFKNPDETYYAVRVKVEDFFRNEIELKGNITELTDSYLIVGGITFSVDSSIKVFDHLNNPIQYSALSVGQMVEVKGEKTGLQTAKALRVKVEGPEDVEVFGKITVINLDSFELNGFLVYVNTNTLFLNHKNQVILFSDLKVDLFVEVKMVKNPDNTFTALKVKIEDGMSFSKINGTVSSVNGVGIQILIANYSINNETVILDNNFNLITSSQLTNGELVTLWSKIDASSSRVALQIQSKTASPNAVSDNSVIVENFILGQNYPNPFNPSTTISFTLASDLFVSLKVYNVIGQEMKNLVNENLSKGSYNINFSAEGLSSGMYLYRLESGNLVQVRKMLLLK